MILCRSSSRGSWVKTSIVVAMLVFFPLISIALMATQGKLDVWLHLSRTVLPGYLFNSAGLMLGVGINTLIIGAGSAWAIARYDFPGRNILQWALLLPLAMPAYITAYSYTGLLDVSGPVQSQLREAFNLSVGDYWFPKIRSLSGAIAVMSLVLYPYVYLLARSNFIEQSSSLQKSCQLMGYGPFQSFFRVALPIARPAIVAGMALALMETLADYGTVSYFGVSTFTTGIFRTWFGMDEVNSAAQLALLLLFFVAILMTLEYYSRQRARYYEAGHHQKPERISLQGSKAITTLLLTSLPVLLGFIIPSTQLFIWSLESYKEVINHDFFRLVINSISLAAITAVIAVLLALLVSYARRTNNNKRIRLTHKIVLAGYAIPGTVIAIGLLSPLANTDKLINNISESLFGFSTGLLLSGTVLALILAYLVRFLSVSVQTVDSGLAKISPNMEQAAQSLGKSPRSIVWTIHAPILSTSLLTAALIVFVDVMKELPATLILRPFNFNTLAVKSFELASDELLTHAAPAALTIVAVGLIPVILLSKAIQQRRQ